MVMASYWGEKSNETHEKTLIDKKTKRFDEAR